MSVRWCSGWNDLSNDSLFGEGQRSPIDTHETTAKQDLNCKDAQNALGILKLLASAEDDLKNGRVQTQDELFAELEKSFK